MFRYIGVPLLLLSSCALFGQSGTTAPAFEVADVKVNKSGELRMMVDMQGGGRLTMRNVPMKVMIVMAYHVRPEMVTGGPGWLDSDRFDVVAKAAQTTTPDDLRLMLRSLLAERFKLAVHREPKLTTAYALALSKSGPKMRRSDAALLTDQRCTPGAGSDGQKRINCAHMTMAMFADQLQEHSPRDFDVPVVDQTGLAGAFDFTLDWSPATRAAQASADPQAGPAVFEAVEAQLGLKLERRKLSMPAIVVDRVERVPVEN